MIRFDMEQGSVEWSLVRMGIPTASNFDRILTPTGKPSAQAADYLRDLIAERMLGAPIDAPKTAWMQRGNELEGEAICFYEFERDVAIERVGFLMDDAGTRGASPDGMVGDDGLVEIKCPSPSVHVGYLLGRGVDKAYFSQIQGQLLVSGRAWTDIVSYHPLVHRLPPAIVRVERDEDYIAKLSVALDEFAALLRRECEHLAELGYDIKDGRKMLAERARKRAATEASVGDDGL